MPIGLWLVARFLTRATGGARIGPDYGELSGEPCRTRTYNLEIKSLLLYQLS